MEPLTIRIPADLRETLDDEADEYGVSVSEHVRTLKILLILGQLLPNVEREVF